MTKGRLARNKRKRKNIYHETGPRVKVRFKDEITVQGINEMQKARCIVILKGREDGKENYVVHKVNLKEKSISVAYLLSTGYGLRKLSFLYTYTPYLISEKDISINPSESYQELEEKIKIVEESGKLEKSLEASKLK